MTRDKKLYELRMLVLGYMQNEDAAKAKAALDEWGKTVKKADENE